MCHSNLFSKQHLVGCFVDVVSQAKFPAANSTHLWIWYEFMLVSFVASQNNIFVVRMIYCTLNNVYDLCSLMRNWISNKARDSRILIVCGLRLLSKLCDNHRTIKSAGFRFMCIGQSTTRSAAFDDPFIKYRYVYNSNYFRLIIRARAGFPKQFCQPHAHAIIIAVYHPPPPTHEFVCTCTHDAAYANPNNTHNSNSLTWKYDSTASLCRTAVFSGNLLCVCCAHLCAQRPNYGIPNVITKPNGLIHVWMCTARCCRMSLAPTRAVRIICQPLLCIVWVCVNE